MCQGCASELPADRRSGGCGGSWKEGWPDAIGSSKGIHAKQGERVVCRTCWSQIPTVRNVRRVYAIHSKGEYMSEYDYDRSAYSCSRCKRSQQDIVNC